MLTLTKWIAAPAVAAMFFFAGDAPKAEAGDGFSLHAGRFGIHIGGHHDGHHRSYRHVYRPRHYGHSYHHRWHGRHRGYHDTTHFDYHPPEIRRHGFHYDYIPGHYDLHRSGHWHH